jgi:hypothetical protein
VAVAAVDTVAALTVLDPRAWLAANVPEAVPAPFAPFHAPLVRWPAPGERQARVVFRGAAKTTLTRALVMWAAVHGHCRGVLWIRATDSDGEADRDALERWGTIAGVPTRRRGHQRMLLVNGVPVWTRSPGAAVRGLQYVTDDGQVIRPDVIIVDDVETRETARSATQTDVLRRWLTSDAIPTSGQGAPARVIMLGTPITPTCLVAQAMRREGIFATWTPPLVVPIVTDGAPAWPALWNPAIRDDHDDDTWANEYLLDPLPAGSLVFPPARTVWVERPSSGQAFIGVDPAGSGRDRFAIVASAVYPSGLCFLDADAYDGPVEGAPDRVAAMVHRLRSWGITPAGVSVEQGGDWRWAASEAAKLIAPVKVVTEAPVGSKLERAMPLTRWHHRRRVLFAEHLRGSVLDVEFHTWTRQGFTVTGHDDTVDAAVWSGGLSTHGWRTSIPG